MFPRFRRFVGCCLAAAGLAFVVCRAAGTADSEVCIIGSRLELFADDSLVGRLDGTALRLHAPCPAGEAIRFDQPWEGAFAGYVTVIQDDARYLMYYRGLPVSVADGTTNEVTCLATSDDGIRWRKPALGLYEVHGTRSNNVVLAAQPPFSHNFAPFLDRRPGIPADERFKAFAGTSSTGLHVFASADGTRWRRWSPGPVITRGAFDSQNVGFWSELEGRYVVYVRTWTGGEFAGFRTISRAESTDLLRWSRPMAMSFGGTPMEHLYTSQTHPYFRAPHLYVATPMRFVPGRRVLSPAQARNLGVDPDYAGDAAETVFMTSRGGYRYFRTFMEGFIRPGTDPGNWASRAGMSASGVIPTGPAEMSLFKQAHYAQPSARLDRYTLRTDGFASVHAPFEGGEFTTRALRFTGTELVLNVGTGAAGGVRVEIQDADGNPVPGHALADAEELAGDDIARVARWKSGPGLGAAVGRVVRLRFAMKDADLYSMRFR